MSEVKVPKGYKQTEFGVSPVDWKQYKLEEIADVIDPHPSHRAPPEVKNGIPFLGIGDLDEHGRIIKDSYRTVGHHIFDEHSNRYNLSDGLIGLGRVASIGKVVKFDKLSTKFTISPTLGLIRSKSVHFDYLAHFLKSDFVLNQFRQIMSGSTRSSVGMQVLRKLTVLLPSPEEQTAIANALTNTDNLIQSLEKLIAKKEAIKTGTMQQLLTGKTRLPEFATREDGSPKGFKQTELGRIPKDWETLSLGDIANIKTGSKNNQDKTNDGKYPFFVRSKNIEKINTYSYDCEAIAIPGEGNIGEIFHYINGKFDAHQRVYVINNFSDICMGKYIYFQLKSNFGRYAMQNTVKATVDSLRLPTFKEFQITLPSKQEQTAIATILSDMDAEIEALKDRLEKTKEIKQGMMQQLLTGKIRLVSPDQTDITSSLVDSGTTV